MAVTAKMYSNFPYHLANNALDESLHATTKLKCMLCTSTYTPNQDTHDFKDDVTNEVEPGGNYSARGVACGSATLDLTDRVLTFDAADAEWTSSTITARYAVLYLDINPEADGECPLILYVDFDENKSSDNGTFKVEWHTDGIFTITVPA